jgi:hypothetical protein
MADEKELESLAKRYLDVWESQLAGMAADSELAAQLGRLFAATNSALLAGLKAPHMDSMAAAGATDAAKRSGGPAAASNGPASGGPASGAAAPGAAAVAAAPGDRGLDLGELADRLAAVEQRLAALEHAVERRLAERDQA